MSHLHPLHPVLPGDTLSLFCERHQLDRDTFFAANPHKSPLVIGDGRITTRLHEGELLAAPRGSLSPAWASTTPGVGAPQSLQQVQQRTTLCVALGGVYDPASDRCCNPDRLVSGECGDDLFVEAEEKKSDTIRSYWIGGIAVVGALALGGWWWHKRSTAARATNPAPVPIAPEAEELQPEPPLRAPRSERSTPVPRARRQAPAEAAPVTKRPKKRAKKAVSVTPTQPPRARNPRSASPPQDSATTRQEKERARIVREASRAAHAVTQGSLSYPLPTSDEERTAWLNQLVTWTFVRQDGIVDRVFAVASWAVTQPASFLHTLKVRLAQRAKQLVTKWGSQVPAEVIEGWQAGSRSDRGLLSRPVRSTARPTAPARPRVRPMGPTIALQQRQEHNRSGR